MFGSAEKKIVIPGSEGGLQAITQGGRVAESSSVDTLAVVCHPHPLMGGTMNNKVVHTVCRTFRDLGADSVRFNFRGVEKSAGQYADGIGETDDLIAVINWSKQQKQYSKIIVSGFSFGSFVAANSVTKLYLNDREAASPITALILIAPPVPRMGFSALLPLPINTLVIQGAVDEVVDPGSVYSWCAQDSQHITLVKVDEATHFFHGKLTHLKNIIQEHFS